MDRAYTRTYRFKKIVLAQSLALLIVILAAGSLIFYAQGYSINFKNFKIIKNGLMVLKFTDKPDKIKVSGREIKAKETVANTMQGGEYNVVALKDGCENWERNIKIVPEVLSEQRDIIFIVSNATISSMTQDEINWMNSTPDSSLAESPRGKLSTNSYEIWLDERLITRVSSKISQVKWYSDNAHITYLTNDEIRIIDTDGLNNTTLIKLDEAINVKYLFRYQGKVIYFRDNDKYHKAKVRCD
jgi:hypothetical protein